MRTFFSALASLLYLLLLGSCSSYMTQSKNVSNAKKDYSKILVYARGKNEIARSIFEQDVAAALQQQGINAVAGHKEKVVDVPAEKQLSREESEALKQELLNMGFDGVVITHLVDTEQYREVIPTGVYPSTDAYNYGQFGYYWTYYPAFDWAPGLTIEGTRYELESALYDLRNDTGNTLQWIGRFKLEDPKDLRKTTQGYARELVSALMKESISRE
ncbi:hypothetical protein [Robiginitalea marina]|uniref:DUF4136 domain-containing protein n=1 Tax=Robiginitalea marina TaxID=2954105 RepID=A0ABT1B2I6_9FLAO|nr:hypothetical protein [Robiginitalea marina]MCO5726060.1 hypothetical protein [Robiginitalea marina]